MKFYFYLFLIALICCNPIEKKETTLLDVEIDDDIKNLINSVMTIAENCNFNLDCIMGQVYPLFENLPEETQNKLLEIALGDDCEDFCKLIVTEVLGSTGADLACSPICSCF